jgi:hypothetical protein
MSEDLEPQAKFDALRLMDEVRKADPEAIAQAFSHVFDNGLGRLVLALHLMESGVGNPIGRPGMSAEELFYAVGRHDAAISLAARVYDPAALAVATLTGELEGSTNEHETDLQGEFTSGLGAVGDPDDLGG